MSPYSSAVGDSIAPDGCTAFDWQRKPVKTAEQIAHESYKADQLVRYEERKAGIKRVRPYGSRFATLEAYENHKASSRAWAKERSAQRTAERQKLNATRVNKADFFISPTPQKDADRTRKIQGSSNRYKTI